MSHSHTHSDEHTRSPSSGPKPNRRFLRWSIVAIGVVMAARIPFVVPETESAIVTRFGRPLRTIEEAGLRFKLPFESRIRLDRRLQLYDPRPAEFLTRDKKNLVVDSAICWRIVDPERFLQTVGEPASAELRLHDFVWAATAAALGRTDLSGLVSTDPSTLELEAMLDRVREVSGPVAREQLGIEIVDVQLERLGFPEQNKQAVFARMRAERDRIAKEYRAQGEEQAIVIRAEADRQRAVLLAQAQSDADKVLGEGEAQAARIYGEAYRQSPELYRFLRTLESYEAVLDEGTTLILSTDSELMRLLKEGAR